MPISRIGPKAFQVASSGAAGVHSIQRPPHQVNGYAAAPEPIAKVRALAGKAVVPLPSTFTPTPLFQHDLPADVEQEDDAEQSLNEATPAHLCASIGNLSLSQPAIPPLNGAKPEKKPRKPREKKDPAEPKKTRAPTAYNIFQAENKNHPEMLAAEKGTKVKKMSELWKRHKDALAAASPAPAVESVVEEVEE